MARKTTGTTTTNRSKKKATLTDAAVMPLSSTQAAPEVRKNMTAISGPVKTGNLNLDEEIRRRAYELYLQRNGAAGDPNRDWLVAEREVRARHSSQEQPLALAASQGRS